MFADLLRSMLHLLICGLASGRQLRPDALPVVGEHGLASHGTAGEGLYGCAVLNGDRLRSVGHFRDERRRNTEMPSKAYASPSLTRQP